MKLLIAWLVLLALPVQALAAQRMSWCPAFTDSPAHHPARTTGIPLPAADAHLPVLHAGAAPPRQPLHRLSVECACGPACCHMVAANPPASPCCIAPAVSSLLAGDAVFESRAPVPPRKPPRG
ncbi:MAG TPA: hypothetical protein VGD76_09255 [Ramlibacter sp.]